MMNKKTLAAVGLLAIIGLLVSVNASPAFAAPMNTKHTVKPLSLNYDEADLDLVDNVGDEFNGYYTQDISCGSGWDFHTVGVINGVQNSGDACVTSPCSTSNTQEIQIYLSGSTWYVKFTDQNGVSWESKYAGSGTSRSSSSRSYGTDAQEISYNTGSTYAQIYFDHPSPLCGTKPSA